MRTLIYKEWFCMCEYILNVLKFQKKYAMSVIIETSIGDVTVDLYTKERPRCCMNFLKLCKIKYYNFSLFHTIQKDLVAQTGDPTASGRGGESVYSFLYGDQARFFEMEVVPRILHNKKGLLSMVNNGSGMHGSQFFITLADSVDYLNNKHTVFGEVAEGMDIVDKLNDTFCDNGNRPHQDIRIYHTVILDDPYDDLDGLTVPSNSPLPTQEMLDSDRIPCDADILDEQGMSEEQLAELAAEREAKSNTQILEMVGDLPDEDVAPPDTVLFVCKLNPVTTSDDLEIIFSRFGNILSCEVIKDQKTGESLQYAFVEFERQEDCETAYFKMDNVLIDDRRIHVDFSQSVSKLKWKGKGKGVEIMKDGDAPKYVLKSQQRDSRGYDLVYAHDDLDDGIKETKKSDKKHSKSRRTPEVNRKQDHISSKKDDVRRSERREENDRRDKGRRRDSREKEPKRQRYDDYSSRKERSYHRGNKYHSDSDSGNERFRPKKESYHKRSRYSDEESERYRSKKEKDSHYRDRRKFNDRDNYRDNDDYNRESKKHGKEDISLKKKERYYDLEEDRGRSSRKKKRDDRSDSEEYVRKEKKKKKKRMS